MIFDEPLLDDIDDELTMENYKPLPKSLTIKQSNIDGLGLFATVDIEKNTTLGVSHVKHHDYLNGYTQIVTGKQSESINVALFDC